MKKELSLVYPLQYYYVVLFFCVAVQRKSSFVEGVVIEKNEQF